MDFNPKFVEEALMDHTANNGAGPDLMSSWTWDDPDPNHTRPAPGAAHQGRDSRQDQGKPAAKKPVYKDKMLGVIAASLETIDAFIASKGINPDDLDLSEFGIDLSEVNGSIHIKIGANLLVIAKSVLRYYQEEALNILKRVISGEIVHDIDDELVSDKGIINLPTASGKTRIFLELLLWANMPISVITSPTISLTRQLEDEFKKLAAKHGKEDHYKYLVVCSDPNKNNGDEEEDEEEDEEDEIIRTRLLNCGEATVKVDRIKEVLSSSKPVVLFAVNNSLEKIGRALLELNRQADITIYDEGHRACDKQASYSLDNNNYPCRFRFFFTATVREKISNTETILDYPMTDKGLFGGILYKKTPYELITEGFILAPWIIATEFNDAYSRRIASLLAANNIDMEDDVNQESALFLSGLVHVYEKQGKIKTIAFVQSLKVANWYMDNFTVIKSILDRILGHIIDLTPSVISQYITGIDRVRLLANFDRAENAILFNYQVIKEGIDVRDCNSVAWMRKMDSIGLMQSMGRCLRTDPNDPRKIHGYIICPLNIDSKDKGRSIRNMKEIALRLMQDGYRDTVVELRNVQGLGGTGYRAGTDRPDLGVNLTPGDVVNFLANIEVTEEGLVYRPVYHTNKEAAANVDFS